MTSPKHIALVGVGHWGRYILRDLKSLGCRVTCVARSPESISRAEAGGADYVVSSVAEISEVDGIIVAVPSSLHSEALFPIVELGVPIFVEKPLTTDAASARKLAELAPDHLFVMEKWRYHPGVELMRDIVKSGELGSVIGYKSTRVRWGNPHRDADCIWNFLPHDLSIVHEVLGYIPTPKSAVSEVLNGVAVSLQALMGDSPWASVEVSCNERTVRQEVRLICEKGVVLLSDPYADHLMIEHLNPADIEKPLIEKRTISTEFPLLLELRAFLDHLSGGPPPRASAANGAMIVEMIARLRTMAGLPN